MNGAKALLQLPSTIVEDKLKPWIHLNQLISVYLPISWMSMPSRTLLLTGFSCRQTERLFDALYEMFLTSITRR